MVALQWQNPQLALYSSEAALGWMLGLARAVQHLHAASPQVRAAAAASDRQLLLGLCMLGACVLVQSSAVHMASRQGSGCSRCCC
jgi:hypothetical protein